jgi:hypothetical protein
LLLLKKFLESVIIFFALSGFRSLAKQTLLIRAAAYPYGLLRWNFLPPASQACEEKKRFVPTASLRRKEGLPHEVRTIALFLLVEEGVS